MTFVPTVAFAKILLRQGMTSGHLYGYYSNDYPLAEYLSLVSQLNLPIFLGDGANPARNFLEVFPNPAETILHVDQLSSGISLRLNLIAKGEIVELNEAKAKLITREDPHWVMTNDNLFEVQSVFGFDLACLGSRF